MARSLHLLLIQNVNESTGPVCLGALACTRACFNFQIQCPHLLPNLLNFEFTWWGEFQPQLPTFTTSPPRWAASASEHQRLGPIRGGIFPLPVPPGTQLFHSPPVMNIHNRGEGGKRQPYVPWALKMVRSQPPPSLPSTMKHTTITYITMKRTTITYMRIQYDSAE